MGRDARCPKPSVRACVPKVGMCLWNANGARAGIGVLRPLAPENTRAATSWGSEEVPHSELFHGCFPPAHLSGCQSLPLCLSVCLRLSSALSLTRVFIELFFRAPRQALPSNSAIPTLPV